MRFLLGNVELLLVPQMDLSHPGRGILANFRNASAGLRRLHPLRAGTLHLEGLFLAQRTTACPGWLTWPIPVAVFVEGLARHGESSAGLALNRDQKSEVSGKLERYLGKIGFPPNSWRIRFTPLGETSYFAIFPAAARWKAYIIDEPIISTRSSPLRPILYGRSI